MIKNDPDETYNNQAKQLQQAPLVAAGDNGRADLPAFTPHRTDQQRRDYFPLRGDNTSGIWFVVRFRASIFSSYRSAHSFAHRMDNVPPLRRAFQRPVSVAGYTPYSSGLPARHSPDQEILAQRIGRPAGRSADAVRFRHPHRVLRLHRVPVLVLVLFPAFADIAVLPASLQGKPKTQRACSLRSFYVPHYHLLRSLSGLLPRHIPHSPFPIRQPVIP